MACQLVALVGCRLKPRAAPRVWPFCSKGRKRVPIPVQLGRCVVLAQIEEQGGQVDARTFAVLPACRINVQGTGNPFPAAFDAARAWLLIHPLPLLFLAFALLALQVILHNALAFAANGWLLIHALPLLFSAFALLGFALALALCHPKVSFRKLAGVRLPWPIHPPRYVEVDLVQTELRVKEGVGDRTDWVRRLNPMPRQLLKFSLMLVHHYITSL